MGSDHCPVAIEIDLQTMEHDKSLRPKVELGILIFKDGKVLLGKRKHANGLGDGQYAGTGGHLEYMESIEECAKRETLEEAGIEIENVRFLCAINLKDYPPKHYLDIGLVADWKSGEPKVMEPEKLEIGIGIALIIYHLHCLGQIQSISSP